MEDKNKETVVSEKPNPEVKKVKVLVEAESGHTDYNIFYPKGDTLETDVATARWLSDNKIGKLV